MLIVQRTVPVSVRKHVDLGYTNRRPYIHHVMTGGLWLLSYDELHAPIAEYAPTAECTPTAPTLPCDVRDILHQSATTNEHYIVTWAVVLQVISKAASYALPLPDHLRVEKTRGAQRHRQRLSGRW